MVAVDELLIGEPPMIIRWGSPPRLEIARATSYFIGMVSHTIAKKYQKKFCPCLPARFRLV